MSLQIPAEVSGLPSLPSHARAGVLHDVFDLVDMAAYQEAMDQSGLMPVRGYTRHGPFARPIELLTDDLENRGYSEVARCIDTLGQLAAQRFGAPTHTRLDYEIPKEGVKPHRDTRTSCISFVIVASGGVDYTYPGSPYPGAKRANTTTRANTGDVFFLDNLNPLQILRPRHGTSNGNGRRFPVDFLQSPR